MLFRHARCRSNLHNPQKFRDWSPHAFYKNFCKRHSHLGHGSRAGTGDRAAAYKSSQPTQTTHRLTKIFMCLYRYTRACAFLFPRSASRTYCAAQHSTALTARLSDSQPDHGRMLRRSAHSPAQGNTGSHASSQTKDTQDTHKTHKTQDTHELHLALTCISVCNEASNHQPLAQETR